MRAVQSAATPAMTQIGSKMLPASDGAFDPLVSADDSEGGVQVGARFLLQKKCSVRAVSGFLCKAGAHQRLDSAVFENPHHLQ